MDKTLSHIDKDGNPKMVDVSEKKVSVRLATANAHVIFPENVFIQLEQQRFLGKKGSIFQTAIIAGIQAAKKTSDLIPLCHNLMIKSVNVEIEPRSNSNMLLITATVKTTGQTGVEMEALTAASVAALTIYDMTKAISHDIKISNISLKEKTGGKRDVKN